MGILEGLKRTLNIAGSKIDVVLEDEVYSQFDLIRGEVVVTAPEHKLAGKAINLELKEFWTDQNSTIWLSRCLWPKTGVWKET